ncbi:sulfatase-like hydrolase/transferase [Planctomycetales bacterium ZRK34]|nr:sulfatase-like hydrolase/transferase [Planctomycetales bacterium ZRK34]
MKRIALLVVAGLIVWSSHMSTTIADEPIRPNIVLILIDDLGAEALGCYGGTSYQTPNMDRLAAEGMRFDHCYALPVCSPSRAELLTGRYSFRNGITQVILPRFPKKLNTQRDRTFVQMLADAGYATCVAGKWHLCMDFADHRDHIAGAGFEDRYMWRLFRGNTITRHYWNPELWIDDQRADDLGKDKFGDDLFSEHAMQFMRDHRDGPFFVYYPMTLVHSQTATGKNYPASPDRLKPGDDPDADVKPRQAGFAQLVAYTDKLIGKVVDEVDRLGLAENTLVIVTGDNGTDRTITSLLGDRKIRGGKATLTEAGTRVPMIVRWPGTIAPGQVAEELVDFTDFFPTLLDAAGVNMPNEYAIDGRSFFPKLKGEAYPARTWVYRYWRDRWFIRGADYRLDSDGRLWDLREDAYEPKPALDSPQTVEARKQFKQAVAELHAAD